MDSFETLMSLHDRCTPIGLCCQIYDGVYLHVLEKKNYYFVFLQQYIIETEFDEIQNFYVDDLQRLAIWS